MRSKRRLYRDVVQSERLESRLLFSIPEPNDTFDTAFTPSDNIYLEKQYTQSDSVSSTDTDYYKFYNLYGKSNLYAVVNGLSADADLYVYNSNRQQIGSSTNSGNLSEQVIIDLPANQYFYLKVQKYGGGSTNYGIYLLNDYAGDTLAKARDIGTSWGQSNSSYWAYNQIFLNDYMDFRDKTDIFKFQMEAPGNVSLRRLPTQDPGGGALVTNLQLLDANGTVIANGSAGDGGLNLDRFTLNTGTYYVKLVQSAGSGNYQLRITSDYAGDTTATARQLGDITNTSREEYDMVGAPFLPTYQDELDLYKFNVTKTTPLDVYLNIPSFFTQPTFDANLFIAQDSSGDGFIQSNEITSSSNVSGNDELHLAALNPGTYYVGVKQNGAYTGYQLDLNSDLDKPTGGAPTYQNMTKAQNFNTLVGRTTFKGGFGLSPGGDNSDFYKFTLSATARVSVNAFTNQVLSRGSGVPYVQIVKDSNNNQVLDSGESLVNGSGSATIQLSAGTYYLALSGSGGQFDYYGQILADYAGDTPGQARLMAAISGTNPSTQTFQDNISQDFGPGSDVNDFYSFVLPSTYTGTLKTTGVSGEDLSLTLYKDLNNNGIIDAGENVGASDALNSPNETIIKSLTAGKYFVLVKGINGETNYTLTANFGGTPVGDPDDTISEVINRTANIKSLGQFADFNMDPLDDVDLIKLTVTAGQKVGFDVDSRNGSNLNTFLRVFNSSGTQLTSNDNGTGPGETLGNFSYVEYTFNAAGTYYVGVSLAPNKTYSATTGTGDVNGSAIGAYRLYLNSLGTVTAPTVLRVNAGGTGFTTSDGKFFDADTGFTGGITSTSAYAVDNTTDDFLYYTRRFGSNFNFSKTVVNGSYTMTLNFAESFYTSAGQRKFNVFAEGNQILSNFDIVAAAGAGKKAVSRAFSVNVIDGKIDLSFAGVLGDALISSISLTKV